MRRCGLGSWVTAGSGEGGPAATRLAIGSRRWAAPPSTTRARRDDCHSTYHRGQVAAKLKRFGIEQPATDFFFWVIELIPQEA